MWGQMKNIMVLGMGRSGTHAIIQWIANGIGGKVVQENNCFNGWEDKKLLPNSTKTTGRGDLCGTIKSIDDFYLPLWEEGGLCCFMTFDKVMVVVRSPRNWLASSIAAGGWARDYLTKAPKNEPELPVSRVEAYCMCFADFYTKKRVYYDKWLSDGEYRKKVADQLGIKDTGIPKHCKFSSFGKNHNYNSDRYELLNKEQKKLFDSVYSGKLKAIQENWFE